MDLVGDYLRKRRGRLHLYADLAQFAVHSYHVDAFPDRVLDIDLSGEAATARIDIPPALRGIYADRQRGWYVEGLREMGRGWVRTMPTSGFAVKARWDYLDFDTRTAGHSVGQVTLGVNFRPTKESVIKLDYVRGRQRDEFNNRSDFAFMLASLATYF